MGTIQSMLGHDKDDVEAQEMEEKKREDGKQNQSRKKSWGKTRSWYHKIAKEVRRAISEFIGTFALVFVITSSAAGITVSGGQITPFAVAIAAGLILMAMIYAWGQVSGAHFNPIVTLAFTLRGVFPIWKVPIYWFSQFCGALLASAILYGLYGYEGSLGATVPSHVSNGVAVGFELIFSFFLIAVILNVSTRGAIVGANAALAVGGTLALIHLCIVPITGSGVNPFRSLAPAIINRGEPIEKIWIYFLGPICGAIIAVIYSFLISPRVSSAEFDASKGEGDGAAEAPRQADP